MVAETQFGTARAASRSRVRRRARRLIAIAVTIAVGVEVYVFRYRAGQAISDIRDVDPVWAAAAIASSLISMNCFARMQRRMLVANGSEVPVIRMIGLAYAANAINWTFPGGTALSAGYVLKRLRGWGVATPSGIFALVASSVLSSITFVMLVVSCALLSSGGSYGSAVAAAGGLILLLVAITAFWQRPEAGSTLAASILARANRLLRRPPEKGTDGVRRFLTELTSIRPRGWEWAAAVGFAGLNWLTDLLCLVASCRAVNMDDASAALLVSAYIAGMTASSISILPGGFGVIDVAMVLALTAGGVNATSATAGVVLYRMISCALVVAAGWVVLANSRATMRNDGRPRRARTRMLGRCGGSTGLLWP